MRACMTESNKEEVRIPKKYNHQDSEVKWQSIWEEASLYAWKDGVGREETFSIDTPPPTVSGSLHIGHVFSYTQTDLIARYQRMQGKNVFYPMGWDDNGLPTERRVQNIYGITCDPKKDYDSNWAPEKRTVDPSKFEAVSRQNFIEACETLTQEDEAVFEKLWRQLGLSVDWSLSYETISQHSRELSQRSFLEMVEKGFVSSVESPTMWDVGFQTAVAQAEVEDREMPGAYHHIEFQVASSDASDVNLPKTFEIATTRPELLPACIAVVAHPDDERYKDLFGSYAITPLFHAKVPILPAEHADPEKGTGILMVCTFGDAMDVEFWKHSGLPIKQILTPSGHLAPLTFGDAPFLSENSSLAQDNYAKLDGLYVKKAKKEIVNLLQESQSSVCGQKSALTKEPESMMHPVKFYEKGNQPLEFLSTRQWFVRILEHKEALLAQGEKINWHPEFMKNRYDNWVKGLNQEWCISRQRFFGVPFPVWYPLDEVGSPKYDAPIFAASDQLPVDPLNDVPPGYEAAQRDLPNGFSGDPDVMDTWATSSLTPQLMSHWSKNDQRHRSVFPMDLRPQSHEIIRTWAFYTIVKAWIHDDSIPWHHVAISGWILDPDRKKMSKSKGNVVTPEALLQEYSSDAIRYWASRARLGVDTAFDESVFAIGRKLITKLVNASKFVMMQLEGVSSLSADDITEPVDQAFAKGLSLVVEKATASFDAQDYASALDAAETSFWQFCDHYIELVKGRAYREENEQKKRSALATLEWSLSIYLRLFAPFMPYVTEEVWSWRFSGGALSESGSASVHLSNWPKPLEVSEDPALIDLAIQVLSEVRAAKTTAQKNMKHPVEKLALHCDESTKAAFNVLKEDLYRACTIQSHEIESLDPGSEPVIKLTLAKDNDAS